MTTPGTSPYLTYPLDYPRINQFPEWFTVAQDQQYTVRWVQEGKERSFTGKEMMAGVDLKLAKGQEVHLVVKGRGGKESRLV